MRRRDNGEGSQTSKTLLLTQGAAILSGGSNLNTWRCLGPFLLTLCAHSLSTRISGRSNSKRFSLFNLSALFHHSHKIMRVRMTSHKSQSQFRIICISNMLLQWHPFDNMAMPMLALSIPDKALFSILLPPGVVGCVQTYQ